MFTKTLAASGLLGALAAAAPAPQKKMSTMTGDVETYSFRHTTVTASFSESDSAPSSINLASYKSAHSGMTTGGMMSSGSYMAQQSGTLSGYLDANAPFADYSTTPITATPTHFGPDSQISAVQTSAPPAGSIAMGGAATLISPYPTGHTTHGPYSGSATTTGAVMNNPMQTEISPLPLNPTATYYNTDGLLQHQQVIPYAPYGGLGTNGSLPRYMVESDFDYESIMLGLYQEWVSDIIEADRSYTLC